MGDLMEEVVKDMTPRLIGEVYRRFANEKSKQKRTFGLFECQYCEKEFETNYSYIKNGNTKSCGCLHGIKHGLTSHKFYGAWRGMMARCNNPKDKSYKNYGGRGITVCDEWMDVANFVAWCDLTYPNIEGYTLDRINNNKGYSPENCRWVDKTTQNINQRMKSSNTSGFVGIYWHKNVKKWISAIKYQKSHINIGSYLTKEEAVLARDNYIVENKLPHKLSTDYKKEGQVNE